MRLLPGFLLFWFFTLPASGAGTAHLIQDADIRAHFYAGMEDLYGFSFSSANEGVNYLTTRWPRSPWGYVLAANLDWWKMITGENEAVVRQRFREELNQAESRTSGNRDEDLYCKIVINSLRCRYELLNKNYLAGLVILNRSKALIGQAEGKEHRYEPFLLTQGLFHYFMASAREKFGPFSSFLHYDADKKKGIEYLGQLCRSEDPILKTEGNYFLMKIYLEMEKQPARALPYATYLVQHYPGNLIFCYYHGLILGRTNLDNNKDKPSGVNTCHHLPSSRLSQKQIKYLSSLLSQNK